MAGASWAFVPSANAKSAARQGTPHRKRLTHEARMSFMGNSRKELRWARREGSGATRTQVYGQARIWRFLLKSIRAARISGRELRSGETAYAAVVGPKRRRRDLSFGARGGHLTCNSLTQNRRHGQSSIARSRFRTARMRPGRTIRSRMYFLQIVVLSGTKPREQTCFSVVQHVRVFRTSSEMPAGKFLVIDRPSFGFDRRRRE